MKLNLPFFVFTMFFASQWLGAVGLRASFPYGSVLKANQTIHKAPRKLTDDETKLLQHYFISNGKNSLIGA